MAEKTLKSSCNLCQSRHAKEVYSFSGYSLVRCENCSLHFLHPLLTAVELKQIYSDEYYLSPDSNVFGYSDYRKDVDAIILTAIKRYVDIEKDFTNGAKSILDVGCAYGYYLDIARLHGWKTVGVEFHEECSKFANEHFGLNVHHGSYDDHGFGEDEFDVVTCWDVLEHLNNPQRFFEVAHRILRPGGKLFLTTPDIESLPSRIMKSRWMGIKSREHQYFFSRETLSRYLEKNGFSMESCKYVGKYITSDLLIRRLQYYLGPLASILRFAQFLFPTYFYLNPFDILYISAKKTHSASSPLRPVSWWSDGGSRAP